MDLTSIINDTIFCNTAYDRHISANEAAAAVNSIQDDNESSQTADCHVYDWHEMLIEDSNVYDLTLEHDLVIDESDTFVLSLPHRTADHETAREFGHPYLPDIEKLETVENFWCQERKQRYLGHLKGNSVIADFINGDIDVIVFVGLLRSYATEFGYTTLKNLASIAKDAIDLPENTKSFTVCRNLQLSAMRSDDWGGPKAASSISKRPNSLHPAADVHCTVLSKMYDTRTQCVTYDWCEIAKVTEATSARNVAVITNLLYAILIPAYSILELLDLGFAGNALLKEYKLPPQPVNTTSKNSMDETAVLTSLNSMVQYFTGPSDLAMVSDNEKIKDMHLVCAPLRLAVFDKHPVVFVSDSDFFRETSSTYPVVASLSVPSQSTLNIKQRNARHVEKNLLCKADNGISAHIVTPKTTTCRRRIDGSITTTNQHHIPRSVETAQAHRKRLDPHLQVTQKGRTTLLRSILPLSGSYGWFGLVTGNVQGPDVLFSETPSDGMFPPNTLRKYADDANYKGDDPNPLRNRYIDLRFKGIELTETIGNESCFCIRPATLCNSNNMETSPEKICKADKLWTGNVVEGTHNPFFTRSGTPSWYNPDGLEQVFGRVEYKDHVKVYDDTIHLFKHLAEQKRWEANQLDKVKVLNNVIEAINVYLNALRDVILKLFGIKIPKSRITEASTVETPPAASVSRRRKMCKDTEDVISSSMCFLQPGCGDFPIAEGCKRKHYDNLFNKGLEALSMCSMLLRMCHDNIERFIEGECRVVSHDLLRHLYKSSAKNLIRHTIMRGIKWGVTWQRPFDHHADTVLKQIPRCRLPQIMNNIKSELDLSILNSRDTTPMSTRHTFLHMMYGDRVAKSISALTCLEWIRWCVLVYVISPIDTCGKSFSSKSPVKPQEMINTKERLLGKLNNRCTPEDVESILNRRYDAGCYGPPRKQHEDGDESRAPFKSRNTGRVGHLDVYTIAASCLESELDAQTIKVGRALEIYPIIEF
nr:wsv226-like protein [Chionoecetes opilio bacilliform virus]